MRITTNLPGLERVAPSGVIVSGFPVDSFPQWWKRNFLLLSSAVRSQHLVIYFAAPEILFFSVFLSLIPFHRCQITTLDFFAENNRRPWLDPVIAWALRRVSRCLVYFKDSAVFEQKFGVPSSKFYYIPFKVNAWELILAAPTRDEGYIFSGGRSRRDFAALFEAVKDTAYPLKLVIGRESELAPNGSSLRGLSVPANVEILRGETSAEEFAGLLAGARLVVIPLLPGIATQAGIGVYLQAMAARKCVIVSSGPGVSDVLDDRQAIVVPAGDYSALREAIRRAWEDQDLRERYARAGAKYALSLGGEDALRRSVLAALPGETGAV